MKISDIELEEITTLDELEELYITRALQLYDGSKTKAAQALGISVKTLYNKLNKYESKQEPNENHN